MLDARVSSTLTEDGRALADDIATRLTRVGQGCHGTVIIGSGDPMIVRGGEAAPRVMVPLAWHHRPNRIGRDQLLHADAVVLIHEDEIGLITDGVTGDTLVVIAARGAPADGSFLRTTNPYEVVAAATAVAGHPCLGAVIPGIPAPAIAWRALVKMATEAIVEAFIATGGTGPARVPGVTARR